MISTRILNAILIFTAGALLCGALLLRLGDTREEGSITIQTPQGTIKAHLADTQNERSKGLSGTDTLAPGTGLLFVFHIPGTYGFWMKDMHYPIDIVWIDETKTVVSITPEATVESYPEVFYPPRPVQYVLELNAGDAADREIHVGTQLQF